jgi:hypothetical protein
VGKGDRAGGGRPGLPFAYKTPPVRTGNDCQYPSAPEAISEMARHEAGEVKSSSLITNRLDHHDGPGASEKLRDVPDVGNEVY